MQNPKNTETLSDVSKFLLYNISNYKPNIENSITDILNKFVSIIVEYLRLITKKISMKNKAHYRFILERGLETVIHVFSVTFYYTKNLDITVYHAQKAYYFYIEYIEQISDDNITFLQLSSRDAILFVYKKTIFDLNNEYKKKQQDISVDDKAVLSCVDTYTNMYNIISQFIINNISFDTTVDYIESCCSHMEILSQYLNKVTKHTDYINIFINVLSSKKIDINMYFSLLVDFMKRIKMKKKRDDMIIDKIYEIDQIDKNTETSQILDLIFE
jgi:hypothetical protein